MVGKLYLRLFPEIDLFPTYVGRLKARGFVRTELQSLIKWGTAIGFFTACLLLWFGAIAYLASSVELYIGLPTTWGVGAIGMLVYLGIPGLVFRMVQGQIRGELRAQLIEEGVPICIGCGYCLRGQTENRCPECGSRFDTMVLELDAQRRKRRLQKGQCEECGGELEGTYGRACPQCGAPAHQV